MKNHGPGSRKGAEPCGRWCLGKKDQLILLYPSIVIISSSKGQRRKKHKFEMLYIQCSFKAFFTEVSNTKMSLMAPLQPTSRGWLSVMNTPLEVGFDGAIWSWRHSCRASPCWETIRIGTEGGLGLPHERLLGSLWKTRTTNADFRFFFLSFIEFNCFPRSDNPCLCFLPDECIHMETCLQFLKSVRFD